MQLRTYTRLLVPVAILFCSACFGKVADPSGEGPKAEAGYKLCKPLIEALEKSRAAKQTYPISLAELVPSYLDSLPANRDVSIAYQFLKADDYELTFRYYDPRIHTCVYRPRKDWFCRGHR